MRLALLALAVAVTLAGCGGDAPHQPGGGDGGVCEGEGQVDCGDGCIDTAFDRANCGGCGHACSGDTPFCVTGECQETCRPLAECDGVCVSLNSSPDHCGSCDRACDSAAPNCSGGECRVESCQLDGTTDCGSGECADLQHDPRHCGACGVACDAGQLCEGGTCVDDDPCDGLTLCPGGCADLASDRDNCGACGVECEGDDICVAGECACPGGDCDPCEVGRTDCDPSPEARDCRDLTDDQQNCGECGHRCGDGESCIEGDCIGECGAGEGTLCDGECVDLRTDPDHCGRCDIACGADHACVDAECRDGVPLPGCDQCPCEDCPESEEPPQQCCEAGDLVLCVPALECPEL